MQYGLNNNLGSANNINNRTQTSSKVNKNYIKYLLKEIKKIR